MTKTFLTIVLSGLASQAAAYDSRTEGYIGSNILGIFYHELGHALIDYLELPIFGQEEDAADVLSVYLIDAFFDEETAVELAYDTAFGFYAEAEEAEDEGYEVVYWGVHGPDLQRYYNLVCLFYGANPEERDDVAEELGLPDERAETCEEEYEQAAYSWGNVLADMAESGGNGSFVLQAFEPETEDEQLIYEVVADEFEALNDDFSMPQDVPIEVTYCDEANAFYDPSNGMISMCIELVPALAKQVTE